jgi:hypothetical protein
MNLGFTGTERGMTVDQRVVVDSYLKTLVGEFHHGDCIGADEQAHNMVNARKGVFIVIHPPEDDTKRAFCLPVYGTLRPTLPYLTRNHDIVDDTDELLATPAGPERLRSGTWATIRYADKVGKLIRIIHPDGHLEVRNG